MNARPDRPEPPIVARGHGWVVLDKPAGLPVHAGPRGGHSLEAQLPVWLGQACQVRQPVHRLDADTSGCLLVATRRAMLRRLAAGFADRRVGKLYLALLDTIPSAPRGRVDAPLRKVSSRAGGWRMVADAAGQPASTDWVLIDAHDGQALLAMLPGTGRTHQLRVHAGLVARGAAIHGDPLYGKPGASGLMLHALGLAFAQPDRGEIVVARSAWPARFTQAGFGCDARIEARLQPLLRSIDSMASAIADGSRA